jgi:hypothetical protein
MEVFAAIDEAADWLDSRRARPAGTTAQQVGSFLLDPQ